MAKNRVGGYCFLGDTQNKITINGAINIIEIKFKNIVSSAAEVEIAGVFINVEEAVPITRKLIEKDHPQQAVKIITENSTTSNILNNSCKQLRFKAIDMRYF